MATWFEVEIGLTIGTITNLHDKYNYFINLKLLNVL